MSYEDEVRCQMEQVAAQQASGFGGGCPVSGDLDAAFGLSRRAARKSRRRTQYSGEGVGSTVSGPFGAKRYKSGRHIKSSYKGRGTGGFGTNT
jgi:hypothetical protein